MAKKRKVGRKAQGRVSEKIGELRREGVAPERAAAAAYSMERAGRLGEGGVYHRAHPKGSRRSPFAREKARHRSRKSRR